MYVCASVCVCGNGVESDSYGVLDRAKERKNANVRKKKALFGCEIKND